jgi:hypothetical protein
MGHGGNRRAGIGGQGALIGAGKPIRIEAVGSVRVGWVMGSGSPLPAFGHLPRQQRRSARGGEVAGAARAGRSASRRRMAGGRQVMGSLIGEQSGHCAQPWSGRVG